MSAKNIFNCRKCSMVLIFMALLQVAYSNQSSAQAYNNKCESVNQWLTNNLEDLGGSAIHLVHDKNGNIIYNHCENNLCERQKRISNFLAKRQGNNSNFENCYRPSCISNEYVLCRNKIVRSEKELANKT